MNENDPKVKRLLDEMKDVPPRDPHAAARGRARFLAQAVSMQPAVSGGRVWRLTGWNNLSRKERFFMNALISTILVITMLFGGAATVSASQDALPTETLYPVKTLTEDFRLWLNTDPQTEIDLLMQMAQTRVQEMAALTALGIPSPARVNERLNQQIESALQAAAGMDDPNMQAALLQMRTMLQTQIQTMSVLQAQASGESAQILSQTRTMLENRIRLVDSGIADPQGFRNTIRLEQHGGQTGTSEPVQGPGGPQPQGTPSPGGSGYGPQRTPAPGGNGAGSGSAPGSTDQPGQQGPNPSITPAGSNGYGPQGTPAPGGNGAGSSGAPGSNDQPGQQGPNPSVTPGGSNGPGPVSNPTPGGQGGQTGTSEPVQGPGGPQPQGTPSPGGSGYGPQGTPAPGGNGAGSGSAPGSTDQPGQQGSNPSVTPGGSNGPGPGSNPTPGGQGGQGGH